MFLGLSSCSRGTRANGWFYVFTSGGTTKGAKGINNEGHMHSY